MKLADDLARALRRSVFVLASLAAVAAACSSDEKAPGDLAQGCLINSDCSAPLVCAFRRCHNACESTRDCPAGLRCVESDRPIHVCQLAEEQHCAFNSDCPAGQVCAADAQCRDECQGDSDCLRDQTCVASTCVDNGELRDGGLPAVATDAGPSTGRPCSYNSECPSNLVCRSSLCQLECLSSVDCTAGRQCVGNRCQVPVCPETDAGGGIACAYSSDCPTPLVCHSGSCACECQSDGDCPSGYQCSSNRCSPSSVDTVGPEGGIVVSPDRRLTLDVPAGALAARVHLTIGLADAWPQGALGPVFDIGPSGTQFAKPVSLVYRYQANDIAPAAASDIRLAVASGANWTQLATTIDLTASTATAQTTHLSIYGLVGPGVGGATDAGGLGGDGGGSSAAASLDGLLWQLPCAADLSSTVCATVANQTKTAVVGGTPGVTYDVRLHFRGVVEQKTYTGGCSDGAYWLTAGADNGDSYNVYRLSVSSPAQTFFLNRGASNIGNTYVLDYEKTIRMDAGATVTLYANTVDSQQIKNLDVQGAPLSIAGTMVAQPYNGQFIQMDVVSALPDPVAKPTTGAGSALSFAGSQMATIADAASIDSADVTLEGWFRFSRIPTGFSTIVGKGFQTGSGDSYTIWFESGALHAGANVSSTAGAAGVPWSPVVDEWHHAAMTFASATAATTLYIDGLAVSCISGTATPSYDNHPMFIGADSDNGATTGFWLGLLDEVRIFSTARTADQVYADMYTRRLGPTPGLTGEWTFDEGTGQAAADSSGSKNDATLGATTTVETSYSSWVPSTAP